MRRLLILAALLQVLLAQSSNETYQCQVDKDDQALEEAVQFINDLHHHGYKFKLVKKESRKPENEGKSCDVLMAVTLEETKCHVVNPKPLDECEIRPFHETKVTAKCNVTVCGGGPKTGIKQFTCDTEPVSNVEVAKICPDCPALLPLHDSRGLESVKAAVEKFNKDSDFTKYFKLLEVGRLTTQHNMMFGQTYFAEFALVETECSDQTKPEEKPACKPKCSQETRHGFCKSTQLGNGSLTVTCEIYEAQNSTQIGFKPKRCGQKRGHHGHSGSHERMEHGPGQGSHEHKEHGKRPGDHTRPASPSGPPPHPRKDCFIRPPPFHGGPHHRGPPPHGRPPHHGGPPPHGGPPHGGPPRGGPPRGGPPHGGGPPPHAGHPHQPKDKGPKPTRSPHQLLPAGKPTPPGSKDGAEFPFPLCHGFVKIPPSVYPICPFPSFGPGGLI
ncbi:alpha-2-HS-glycoprotein 1 [Astyanax mexicanus]|uniref:Antihemorrhagic factor cHLP-B-like n=2 Tax=Astyanax mexicanus TaxID=7994 RepID=A0A8T2L3D4_ASTMX|nr:alpha-2-HS-glycoprotein 1 [Astyanax mexicanus]KAG9266458.1 antihemorrhagic factor cHLP-B-like [Astyanax mexicanus]